MIVDTVRFDDLESVMTEMRLRDGDYRYSVAWVDCMTSGTRMGRSILRELATRPLTMFNTLVSNHRVLRDLRSPFVSPQEY